MCGIAGHLKLDGAGPGVDLVKQMIDVVAHRGPDATGTSICDGPLAFGHCRLAIQDLSHDADQPFNYMDRYTIVYNGEIYNFKELRRELEANGFLFMSQSDTEVVLAAYAHWGDACVTRFNGMWSFAIWDSMEQRLFCSRDRFGIKPFYYVLRGTELFFSSEMKQLLSLDSVSRAENEQAVFDYFYYAYSDHTEGTFFKDILQLRGGHNLVCQNGKATVVRYYDLPMTQDSGSIDPGDSLDRFRDLFASSVSYRLISDVPVGSSLSGGLDSSAVVAVAHTLKNPDFSYDLFTSAFEGKEYDERRFAKAIVDLVGGEWHQVLPTLDTLLEDLDRLVYMQERPFRSLSIYAQYCVFREAHARGLKVMLDGQGADEILMVFPYVVRDLISRGYLRSAGRIMRQVHDSGHMTMLGLVATIVNQFLPTGCRDTLLLGTNRRWIRRSEAKRFLRTDDYVDLGKDSSHLARRQHKAIVRGILPELLQQEDRNAMAFSIEARVPFLDHRLVEFAVSLPTEQRIIGHYHKSILRRAFRDQLPETVLNRKDKMAFAAPTRPWLQGELGQHLRERCRNVELPAYIDRDRISGSASLWRLYAYCLWKQVMRAR